LIRVRGLVDTTAHLDDLINAPGLERRSELLNGSSIAGARSLQNFAELIANDIPSAG
jgi:hypothetical protein